jgi:CheY-like chemotaxis protein
VAPVRLLDFVVLLSLLFVQLEGGLNLSNYCSSSPQFKHGLSRRVLIADDSPAVTSTLAKLLAHLGQKVYTADNGKDAVKIATTERLDVVLSDLEMPGLDGYELARRIRANGSCRPILVAISGYGQPEDRARALEAGFDRFLIKPATLSELIEVLDRVDTLTPASLD